MKTTSYYPTIYALLTLIRHQPSSALLQWTPTNPSSIGMFSSGLTGCKGTSSGKQAPCKGQHVWINVADDVGWTYWKWQWWFRNMRDPWNHAVLIICNRLWLGMRDPYFEKHSAVVQNKLPTPFLQWELLSITATAHMFDLSCSHWCCWLLWSQTHTW